MTYIVWARCQDSFVNVPYYDSVALHVFLWLKHYVWDFHFIKNKKQPLKIQFFSNESLTFTLPFIIVSYQWQEGSV